MTPAQTSRSRVPPAFGSLAYLYGPEDPGPGMQVAEAGDRWTVPADPGQAVDVVIWGRLARSERPSPAFAVFAARRELAVARVRTRPPGGLRLAELHRLPPIRRPGILRRRIRAVALGGVLAELVRGDRPRRVIDAVAGAAGAASIGRGLRPSGDGSALGRLVLDDGRLAELRVARVGHTKDPARGHAALLALETASVGNVPRPLGGGTTAGAVWSTESVIDGEHAHALSAELLDEITTFLAGMPEGPAGDRASDDRFAEIKQFFPEHADALERVADATRRWGSSLPPVLVHGDMWLNNVFVAGDRLSGVFDWDTWHPAGLPGSDLLNLLGAEERTQRRRDIGPLLVADFWRSPEVVDALGSYFRQRGLPFPDAAGLAAIAVDWWSSRIYGALHRATRLIDDPAWVTRNVDAGLAKVERLERELG